MGVHLVIQEVLKTVITGYVLVKTTPVVYDFFNRLIP